MKNYKKIRLMLKGRKIIKIIKTLFAVVIICANCIIVIGNNDNTINPAQFDFVQEEVINPCEFNLRGGSIYD